MSAVMCVVVISIRCYIEDSMGKPMVELIFNGRSQWLFLDDLEAKRANV